ncbi:MAG: tetratricopeptide (TPR) repeat protein [Myxococcota bacterium]|jgi:tetratricopeptide (TPR) repeat protein
MAVPEGLEAWLGRLLEKSPSDRHRRAADPAADLIALGSATRPPTALAAPPEDTAATFTFTRRTADTTLAPVLVARQPPTEGPSAPVHERRPVPATWRGPRRAPSRALHGAGLGLYGLRPIPLAGRSAERDALRAVGASGPPHLIVLRGASGTGKSRLARWFCERAHELGAADVFEAWHDPRSRGLDALRQMVARALRATNLHGFRLTGHLDRTVDPALTPRLVPLVTGESLAAGKAHGLILSVLAQRARARPVVVWLDDLQWGAQALALTRAVLDRPDLPVLVVATVQKEALALAPEQAQALDAVLAYNRATALSIPPLDDAAHAELVRELLGLDTQLANAVLVRTRGNPLFAVQLVGDWVARDLLVLGPDGFRLRDGESPDLPDDLHTLWGRRIDALVADAPESRGHLERAAALGLEVDTDLWSAATGAAPDQLHGLVTRLFGLRLAEERPAGFIFVHGMLRESIARGARDRGTWAGHHDACAAVLADRAKAGAPGLQARIGGHLLTAGRPAEAVGHLLLGMPELQGAMRDSLALADTCERAMDHAGLAATAPERANLTWQRARLLRIRGRFDEVLAIADGMPDHRQVPGWASWSVRVQLDASLAQADRGQVAEAAKRVASFQHDAEAESTLSEAKWHFIRGVCARRLSEPDPESCFMHSAELYRHDGRPEGVADCLYNLTVLARRAGDIDGALAHSDEALALLPEGRRYDFPRAIVQFGRAQALAAAEHWGEAVRSLAASLALQRQLGVGSLGSMFATLAATCLGAGRTDDARGWAVSALAEPHPGIAVPARAVLLACDLIDDRLPEATLHLEWFEGFEGSIDADLGPTFAIAFSHAPHALADRVGALGP